MADRWSQSNVPSYPVGGGTANAPELMQLCLTASVQHGDEKKFTPDPDQKPGGKLSDAGKAATEATRPPTSGFDDQADFDQEDVGRWDGGAIGIHHSRDKGPTKPTKTDKD